MSSASHQGAGRPATGRRASSAPKDSPYIAGEIIGDKYRLVRMPLVPPALDGSSERIS